jgi:hypothetical protein
VATTMAKTRPATTEPSEEDGGDAGKKRTSLKVSLETGQLIGQLATMRNVSVEKLFHMPDIEDFLTHLSLAEAQRLVERLKNPPRR